MHTLARIQGVFGDNASMREGQKEMSLCTQYQRSMNSHHQPWS